MTLYYKNEKVTVKSEQDALNWVEKRTGQSNPKWYFEKGFAQVFNN